MHLHRPVLALVLLAACACSKGDGDSSTNVTPGSLGLGERCPMPESNDEALQPCKAGLWCIAENDCGEGYCTRRCEQHSDCTDVAVEFAVCNQWNDGSGLMGPKICINHCGTAADCPQNFSVSLDCSFVCTPKPSDTCETGG